jgi:GTP-binding protein HflX
LRQDDHSLNNRESSRSSSRKAPKAVLNPSEQQERAFLVGVEFRSKGRTGRGKTGSATMTAGAQAARDHAASVSASSPGLSSSSSSSSSLPSESADFPAEFASEFKSEFTSEDSLDELRTLATSAGAEIVGEFTQRKDRPDPATLIGKGKLEEIAGAAASVSADVILFDHDLSPSQQRNIERVVDTRVIDRTQLILDIFARHARTREGQLQVELAQLEYMLPRLAGRGIEMSQLGGGIGTRGPGETQLETDRRKIYRRVRHVKEQIENVRRVRTQQRQRRESVPVALVALVGYTNAGKSTLFNALTNSKVLESSRMFATLDPTIRGAELPSKRKILFSDTVGFIRNLPHTLVSAFRATLEEVQRATLILQVSDGSSPISAEQDAQVESVLKELDADKKPRLRVMNKIDLLLPKQRESLRDDDRVVHVSAAKGIGLSALLDRIDAVIEGDRPERVRLRVPQKEGKVLAQLQVGARVLSRRYQGGMVVMEVEAPASLVRRVRSFVVE